MDIENISKCKYIKYIVFLGYCINFLENNPIIYLQKKNIFNDKRLTRKWLIKHNFPHVKEIDYNNIDINKIIVIKPIDGTRGDNIKIDKRKNFSNKLPENFLAEEYINGKHYRIIIYKGNIISILERMPAHIIGNGKNNIKELIDNKNLLRCEKTKLFCDDKCLENTDKILKKNEIYFTNSLSNYAKGGTINIINLKIINNDIFILCQNIYLSIKVDLFGIDFICEDITKSLSNQTCAINEFELFNDIDIHYITNDNSYKFYCKLFIKWLSIIILFIISIFLSIFK